MATTITIGSHIYYPVPRTSVPTQLRWDDDPSSSPEARIYYAHGQPNRYQAGAGAMWRRCADARWGDSYWQLHEERVPPAPPVVRMDGPLGPRIEYGDEHNQSDLDAAMPAGYRLGTDGTADGGRWSLAGGRWRRHLTRIADRKA